MTTDIIAQLHDCSDCRVERLASTIIIADFGNGLVCFSAKVSLGFTQIGCFYINSALVYGTILNQSPQALQKTVRSLYTGI